MAEPATASGRRSFGLLAGLGVASSALFAVGAPRTWLTVTQLDAQTVFSSQSSSELKGSDLAPWVAALALVGLAAWGAVLVSRTRGRRAALGLAVVAQAAAVVGLVSAVVGSAVDDELVRRFGDTASLDTSWSPWLIVAAVAGVVAVAAAAASVVVCGSWPSMGSRYDAPTRGSVASADPDDLWKQLDAGIDPTE